MFGPIFKRSTIVDLDSRQAMTLAIESRLQSSHVLPLLARRLSLLPHPRVLDLGSVVGGNLQFFIDLGCKVTADDLLKPVETVLSQTGALGTDWKGSSTKRLEYPDTSFDAVIAWDLFDFMPPAEAKPFAHDLLRVMKPGGIVLAYFTSRETERREPHRRYRIQSQEKVEWITVGAARTLRHVYKNRELEQMFDGFKTHTAFVLMNGTREMLLEKRLPAATPTITPLVTAVRTNR